MSKNNFFHSALSYEGKILAGYKNQIETQKVILNTIKSVLPDNLSSHALYCVISGKKVSLYTDSAVWSSQLRFYHQTILHALTASNQGNFNLLKIKIIPKTTELEQKPNNLKKLPSSENIDIILHQAENQSDKQLKTALLKLGQTFKKLSH